MALNRWLIGGCQRTMHYLSRNATMVFHTSPCQLNDKHSFGIGYMAIWIITDSPERERE